MAQVTNADKAKMLGAQLDFIENENDVVAVESAVVKIQSTFRGKKVRSKLNPGASPTPSPSPSPSSIPEPNININPSPKEKQKQKQKEQQQQHQQANNNDELSNRVAAMQVADDKQPKNQTAPSSTNNNQLDDAAAKIQAGFKGYKTRKELASTSATTVQTSSGSGSGSGNGGDELKK